MPRLISGDLFWGPSDGVPRFVWDQRAWSGEDSGEDGVYLEALGADGTLVGVTRMETTSAQPIADGVDAAGNAVIAWTTVNGVVGRILSRDGTLGPPVALSEPGAGRSVADVSLSPLGVGHVLWYESRNRGRAYEIKARQVTTDGRLGPILSLGIERNRPSLESRSRLATFESGSSLLISKEGRGKPVRGRILTAARVGRSFSISGPTSRNLGASWASVAATGSDVLVVWLRGEAVRDARTRRRIVRFSIRARSVAASGDLRRPVDVIPPPAGETLFPPSVIGNANGVALVMSQARGRGKRRLLFSVRD